MYDCLLYHFTSSQCILKGALLTFSSTSNQLVEILKEDFSTPPPPVLGLGETYGGQGWAHSTAHPWVPKSSPLTHMVYLLPSSSYSAGSKSVSTHPPDQDTMTNTAREAITSSSSKNRNSSSYCSSASDNNEYKPPKCKRTGLCS